MFQFEYTARLMQTTTEVRSGDITYNITREINSLPIHVLDISPLSARHRATDLLPAVEKNQYWTLALDRIFEPTH